MTKHFFNGRSRAGFSRRRAGQIMVTYAIMLPLMFLFLGLGIDVALIYLSDAKLGRAVDATAIRLARKFDSDPIRRQQVAAQVLRINYPGFLGTGPISWTVTGNVDTAEVMTAAVGNSSIKVTTSAQAVSGIVDVKIEAESTHRTFFMPLAGPAFSEVKFKGNATAQRFPACNILVLDVSGSMRGTRATNLVKGVEAFLDEFVDDRDYVMVVTFSTFAKVVWPPNPDSNDKFSPSKGFLSGSLSLAADAGGRKVMDIVNQKVRFAGATNAAEGVRFAFEQCDQFLASKPANVRGLIKVNYVFFTDGEFNTFRGFARGVGYGITPGPDPRDPETGASRPANPHLLADLPAFHLVKPLLSSSYAGTGPFKSKTGGDLSFTTGTAGINGTYNLASLVGSVTAATMPGVNCTIQGYKGRAGGTLPGGSLVVRNAKTVTGNWPGLTNAIDSGSGNTKGNWRPIYDTLTNNASPQWVKATFVGGQTDNAWHWPTTGPGSAGDGTTTHSIHNASTGDLSSWAAQGWQNLIYAEDATKPKATRWNAISNPSWVDVAREAYKQKYDHAIYLPESQIYSFSNSSSHSAKVKDAVALEYYPGGRAFSNIGAEILGIGTDASTGYATTRGAYMENNGTPANLGPTGGVNGSFGSWNYSFVRMSRFYPYYSYGGNQNYPPDGHRAYTSPTPVGTTGDWLMTDGGPVNPNNGDADWSRIGPPWEYYSFREGKWVNTSAVLASGAFDTASETRITAEGNWLAEAQSWIAREQHDATVFTILLGTGTVETTQRMANDNNGDPFYPNQKVGKAYITSDPTQLSSIFREIAQKISVRISE